MKESFQCLDLRKNVFCKSRYLRQQMIMCTVLLNRVYYLDYQVYFGYILVILVRFIFISPRIFFHFHFISLLFVLLLPFLSNHLTCIHLSIISLLSLLLIIHSGYTRTFGLQHLRVGVSYQQCLWDACHKTERYVFSDVFSCPWPEVQQCLHMLEHPDNCFISHSKQRS